MEENKTYTKEVDVEPINVEEGLEEADGSQQLISISITLQNGGVVETSRWYPDYKYGRENEVRADLVNAVVDLDTTKQDNKFLVIDNISVRVDQVVAIKTVSMISSDNGWQEDIPVAELVEENK